MSLTETTLGQQIDTPAAEPAQSAWLPLTVGDPQLAGRWVQKEHGWPGSLFIFLTNLAAIGCGIGAVVMGFVAVAILSDGEWMAAAKPVLIAAGLALGCVLQGTLARHLRGFTRWGWYGAMAELGFLALSKVNAAVTEPGAVPGAVIGIVVDLLWMRYFWNHRAQFDVDLDF